MLSPEDPALTTACSALSSKRYLKLHPGLLIAKLREIGLNKNKIEGLIDPLGDTGVWVDRVTFVDVAYKKLHV